VITAADYLAPPEAHRCREGLRGGTLAQYWARAEALQPEGGAGPGVGGARVEDTLVVTEDGCERLTTVPKAWRAV